MEETIISSFLLAVLFLVVAFSYSSVGLGGGSSYTALMAIFGVNILAVPTVSLILNVLVTSIGSFNFVRNRHGRLRLIAPFLISSIPMSYLGGSLRLSKEIFYWVLLVTLVFVALRIYIWREVALQIHLGRRGQLILALVAGSVLGLVAGVAGIGGGIYLVPLVVILGLGSAKEAAACGAIFIWANSLAGLAARTRYHSVGLAEFMPLMLAVLIGGTLGSFMGASRFSASTMQRVLGAVVVVAIAFLMRRILVS